MTRESASALSSTGTVRRGRKRNEDIRERILNAGLEVFVASGWRGFTLETVTRAADVGKSSIYLRYSTREELFADLLERYGHHPESYVKGMGSLHDELMALAHSYARWLEGPAGMWGVRMFIEASLNPDFAASINPGREGRIALAHAIIRRAKDRGELPRDAPAAVMLDSLLGALIHHLMTAPERHPYSTPAGERFIRRLVDNVIAGATATASSDPTFE